MSPVPWKEVKAWSCVRCGTCCQRFMINLSSFEYVRLVNSRPDAIALDKLGNPYIKRWNGKCVFQNVYGLCDLQFLKMKPFTCKVWPFVVTTSPKSGDRQRARFYHKGEEYYVYLNPYARVCPGINRGRPGELELTISEVIEIYQNPLKQQKYSTAS